jgi:hypothetical protein
MSHNPSVSEIELMGPMVCSVSAGGRGRRDIAHLLGLLPRIVRYTELVAPLSGIRLQELSRLLRMAKLLRTRLYRAGLSASLMKPMGLPVLLR